MLILADTPRSASRELGLPGRWRSVDIDDLSTADRGLWQALAPGRDCFVQERRDDFWQRLVVIDEAPVSQFDTLRDSFGEPATCIGPTACVAFTGRDFHGHRGRAWSAKRGNLHLSVVMTPRVDAAAIGLALTTLPAVATVDAVEELTDRRPGIKWVNDVLATDPSGRGGKIAGVLTATQSLGSQLEQVVFGIGLNVAERPPIDATVFVPRVTSLAEVTGDRAPGQGAVLVAVMETLRSRYTALVADGPAGLLAAYRDDSLVVGREVVIWPEGEVESPSFAEWPPPLATGRVVRLDDDLALHLAGRDEVVGRGRLAFTENLPAD